MAMRVVSFKVGEELLELLDIYARQRGKSRSEVIREAVARFLSSEVGASKPIRSPGITVRKIRVV